MDAEIQGLLAANNLQEFANDEGLPDFPQEGSQALDEYGDDDDDEGEEVSDADSDVIQLQADIAKFDADVAALRAPQIQGNDAGDSHLDDQAESAPTRGRGRGRGGRRPRGPRKAVEPTGEIKFRLGQASLAMMNEQWEDAMAIIFEVIRINAETHQAWVQLAAIFQEMGKMDEAMMSMVFAAHLRPKDYHGWMATAQFALDDTYGSREKNLYTAGLCFSAAIRANPKSVKARIGKANVSLEQGHATIAATEYERVLKRRPYDIEVIRHMAEASFDAKDAKKYVQSAKDAYQRLITHARAGGEIENGSFEWSDVFLYGEMFAFLEQYDAAIIALRSLARWLVGRDEESFWDQFEDDDREWDRDDERRINVMEYEAGRYPLTLYGAGLPLDLRAKLGIYRLKLGHEEEGLRHLALLDPYDNNTVEWLADTPFVVKEVATQLIESQRIQMALEYLDLCRKIVIEPDPEVLVQQGRCYLQMQDESAAEECFLAAIEADDNNIEARFELAKMYENARENEEAFILVNEAMQLERRQAEEQEDGEEFIDPELGRKAKVLRLLAPKKPARERKKAEKKAPQERKPRPKRYRPRRLGGNERRQVYEAQVTANFKEKYNVVQQLRSQIASGDKDVITTWMAAAKDLVDDFRSFKEFYPWEKYLQFLGYGSFFKENQGQATGMQPRADAGTRGLAAMAERLHHNLVPDEAGEAVQQPTLHRHDHRGIPFDAWLDLFLEYAVSLARTQQPQEAYLVCQSARDSIVYKSNDNMFLIHVAWAACAVYAGDEETCVAVARFFMKNNYASSDSYRMFAALCRACQSPISWYASGPAQKYMLRQIKTMDRTLLPPEQAAKVAKWDTATPEGKDDTRRHETLDVCLLMLYGHILLTSTSYTYALSYFLRALSLDPENPMVNLSIGVAYVHYAFKRQAENRQFLLLQGFNHLFRYYDHRIKSPHSAERQEAHYNLGRAYHLIGTYHLAAEYYTRVLREAAEQRRLNRGEKEEDFVIEAAANMRTYALINGDFETARQLAETWLVLE